MIKRMMLLSAALLMLNTAGADASDALSDPESGDKNIDIQVAVKDKSDRIQTLTDQRKALLERKKQKRKGLLKNNPKIRRMYLQILKQTQQLALELDADREISQMNDQLRDIERNLDKERNELNKLTEKQKLNKLKEPHKPKETEKDK